MTDTMPDNSRKTPNGRLIIRVSRQSLSFSVLDGDSEEISFQPYTLKSGISLSANLREAFRSEELLADDYRHVLVSVVSSTLVVPAGLFQEAEKETLFRHAFTGCEQDEVRFTVMDDLNCVVLFAVNRNVRSVIADHYPGARYMAAVAPVWRHLHQRSYLGGHAKLYGYFHDRRLEVFSYGQNRFKFCNTFDGRDAHDALYYLLYVWKQLGMQADSDELFLVGELPEGQWLVEEAKKYVQHAHVIRPSSDFNRAAVTQMEGMPYDLMTLFVKGR